MQTICLVLKAYPVGVSRPDKDWINHNTIILVFPVENNYSHTLIDVQGYGTIL